ncbi:MAG: hypothetical protein J0L61_02515 [Planctomycetes bacterium]|nr:hypothetical protein [Planctomycetota bacterium]
MKMRTNSALSPIRLGLLALAGAIGPAALGGGEHTDFPDLSIKGSNPVIDWSDVRPVKPGFVNPDTKWVPGLVDDGDEGGGSRGTVPAAPFPPPPVIVPPTVAPSDGNGPVFVPSSSVPAPGAGVLVLTGVGLMARRRR